MYSPNQRKSSRLDELLAKARADLAAANALKPVTEKSVSDMQTLDSAIAILKQEESKDENKQIWSQEQLNAIELARSGRSLCLIGKAGTGKTTVAKEIARVLLNEGIVSPITESTKYLQAGLPGIAVVSFTNRAVKNIAKGMPEDIARHTITVHKLLEFAPEFDTVVDAEGNEKKIRRFVPKRNRFNPLPSSLRLIIFEESSMISTDLYALLMDAIPHECQFIFLGDLQQLPPVYGSAILGFKLLELPVIELSRIYRQAKDSPIIDLAWRVSRGDPITAKDFETINLAGNKKITLRPWKKSFSGDDALHYMDLLFRQFVDNGVYDPEEDMIMIPFNKAFGTIEFNKNLAQHLGKKRQAVVYQIIAGFNKHYYAVGDKVLCDREEAIIEEIMINDMYRGTSPIPPSPNLNRWGIYEVESKEEHERTVVTDDDVDELMLRAIASDKQNEEAKQQGSHILVCRILGSDEIREVRTTGEYAATDFAYALTVHKCQGSEWRKCFVLLHRTHAAMLSRELVYTAITRAKEELIMILEPDTLVKTVKNQRIRGNTIAEKAEYFKGKLEKDD
jgi:ATP-dependent exoDNAse (exonuclease V) alpha subunit